MCDECLRLWNEYAANTRKLIRLQGKAELARLSHNQQEQQELAGQVQEAKAEKDAARTAMRRHDAEAHQGATGEWAAPSLPLDSPASIRERLSATLEQARVEYLQVVREQREVLSDIPSGRPHPDGIFRLQKLASRRETKLAEYEKARRALDDFIKANHNI